MLVRWVIIVAMASRKEALERIGGNASVAELAGRAGGRSETLDDIPALFRSLANTL
jgi:hypothetical protein